MTHPVAIIELESGGIIRAELFPEEAPNTVRNFISLVRSEFYNGLTFHRVIPGFVIQGGDPRGDGTGGPGYSIRGEFAANGHPNPIKHTLGTLSMARSGDPNSAGSQFFIMAGNATHLDGQYAAFGRVTEGMEWVERIVRARRDPGDRPLEAQRISKVTVELFGEEYPEPEKVV